MPITRNSPGVNELAREFMIVWTDGVSRRVMRSGKMKKMEVPAWVGTGVGALLSCRIIQISASGATVTLTEPGELSATCALYLRPDRSESYQCVVDHQSGSEARLKFLVPVGRQRLGSTRRLIKRREF